MPMRSMKLAFVPASLTDRLHYRVILVKNSTEYSPGQRLERPEVEELCSLIGRNSWDITVVREIKS